MTNNAQNNIQMARRSGMDESRDDPTGTYLDRINRIVYGDKIRKQALEGYLRLAENIQSIALTKKKIAEESGLSTKDLYNKQVLKIFSDFAIVYLVPKVHREREVYIIPDMLVSRRLYEAGRHGPLRSDFDHESKVIIERFGRRIERAGSVPIQSNEVATPIEAQMEATASKSGFGDSIDISIHTDQRPPQDTSGKYSFIIQGEAAGVKPEAYSEFKDFVMRKMTSLTKAALLNHRIPCPCTSIEEHLIKIRHNKENISDQDERYFDVREGGNVVFGTELHNIRGD